MVKQIPFSFLIIVFSMIASAQPYYIGHRLIALNDSSRVRDISSHFYYPATAAGDNTTVAPGQFPVIVFGHGFAMGYDAYMNFVDSLIPHGYIICLPLTESGLSPNHNAFGLDLRFLNSVINLKAQNDPTFFLYQKTSGTSAIMGHSMGGGAAFLAAENNTDLTTIVTFAPAETSVSAISAALNVSVPSLIFIGENDGVTPPPNHQIPMYNNLPPECKGFVTILGGGHCYFANYNIACTTGELFTSPQPSITRTQQHQAMFMALRPYLDWILKNNHSQRNVFEYVISQSSTYISQFACNIVSVETCDENFSYYPNPVEDQLYIDLPFKSDILVSVYSVQGNILINQFTENEAQKQIHIDFREMTPGLYFIQIKSEYFNKKMKVVKL